MRQIATGNVYKPQVLESLDEGARHALCARGARQVTAMQYSSYGTLSPRSEPSPRTEPGPRALGVP